MLKSFFLFAFLLFASFAFCQTQKALQTEDGPKVVFIDENDITTVKFTLEEWNNINSEITPTTSPRAICIDLNTRKSGCTKPLGFRCHVFSCDPHPLSSISATQNGYCYINSEGQVEIRFYNPIDWDYLQNQSD